MSPTPTPSAAIQSCCRSWLLAVNSFAAIELQRIDAVKQHGAGSHGTSAGGDAWGAVQLNQAIDQAQDVAGIRARIRRLKAILTDRGVDVPDVS